VTPIAIAFDHRDQLLVVESHTHQRPDDYDGPPHDRLRCLIDQDGDGRADRFETFLEGTAQTMSLARGPDNWIYVATRREIFRARDVDGDGRADERESLVRLETRGDYPHNGLAGLCFSPQGQLFFGLGENLGEAYRLIGADGQALSGQAEGGNVFACSPDGHHLQRVATGFWNPFGNCFDPFGRLFTVDNDPDASPPCRLLHVVPGGDYGYQFRYGRSGRHPLQAWDAELPATLPMAAGTGEAPCQVLPYRGRLWVTSWGDYRIEAYTVQSVGASCQAQPEIIIQGQANFRPVGLAIAADGSLYFSDWVDRSYPVHGQGRIWRLIPTAPEATAAAFPELSIAEQRAAALRETTDRDTLLSAAEDDDPFIRQAAISGLAANERVLDELDARELESPRARLAALAAWRWRDPVQAMNRVDAALDDADEEVCLLALRLLAESNAVAYRPRVVALLQQRQPLGARLGAVALATAGWLEQGQQSKDLAPLHAQLAALLGDDKSPLTLRRLALRWLPSDHQALTVDELQTLLTADAELRPDIIAILADKHEPAAADLLRQIAQSQDNPSTVRADASAALAAYLPDHAGTLEGLLRDEDPEVRREAERGLRRGAAPSAEASSPLEELLADAQTGDPDAGRRVFFRGTGGRCSLCHAHDGRGGDVGPELTTIHRRADRRWLLETILDPNRDVAPRFGTTTLELADGRTLSGQILPGPGDDDAETIVQVDGTRTVVPLDQIEVRHYHTRSLMPEGLGQVLTADELRDLIAFLLSPPSGTPTRSVSEEREDSRDR
jgi:putative membrane-bound dehydrogenase-like protein